MKSTSSSKLVLLFFPAVLAFLLVTMITVFLLRNKSQQALLTSPQNAKAEEPAPSPISRFYGIQYYQGNISSSSTQPITLNGTIYTGTGSPTLAAGNTVVIGVATVGSGQVSVTDSRNNIYNIIKSQPIDKSAAIYVLTSILTTPLQPYDQLTVKNTSAKSIAASALVFGGTSGMYTTSGQSGYNTNPVTPSVMLNKNDIFISVAGFRAKDGDFMSSYSPLVQVQSGASSGTSGNSLDNSSVIIDGFIASASQEYSLPIPLSNFKNKKGIPWGTVATAFH